MLILDNYDGAAVKHTYYKIALLLGMIALVSAAKCNCSIGANVIDLKKLESLLLSQVKDLGITSVTCPEEVDETPGATFQCTAKGNNGETDSFTITVKDDKGNVDWQQNGPKK